MNQFLLYVTGCICIVAAIAESAVAGRFYVLTADSPEREQAIHDALLAADHTVTMGPLIAQFDGITQAPDTLLNGSQFDAVILTVSNNVDIPDQGQRAIVDFVESGGGLITTEWFGYYRQRDKFHFLEAINPIQQELTFRNSATIRFQIDTSDPLLTTGLFDEFQFPGDNISGGTESFLIPKATATTLFSSDFTSGDSTGAGVIGWSDDQGLGRVLSLSTTVGPMQLDDPEFGTLFNNVAAWVARDGDYNDNGVIEQGDLDLVLLHWGSTELASDSWTNNLPTGPVDQHQLDHVLLGWGSGGIAPAQTMSETGIPEPTGFALLTGVLLIGLASSNLLTRRRTHATDEPAI